LGVVPNLRLTGDVNLSILTRTERRVMAQLTRGKDRVAIGRLLGISPQTVANHARALFTKLGVHNRAELLPLLLGDELLNEIVRKIES
jgi:DNA-binding CsgD family transcriptional regulator